ncbi:MAG TPA: hypothetical protein V6C97_18715 [Oculatellaceae cyanobacterium]
MDEYDVIGLCRTPVGARLTMHRFCNFHKSVTPSTLNGGLNITTKHRAEVIAGGPDGLEITSKYDSPQPGFLHVEITTKRQGGVVSKETFHLKKQLI